MEEDEESTHLHLLVDGDETNGFTIWKSDAPGLVDSKAKLNQTVEWAPFGVTTLTRGSYGPQLHLLAPCSEQEG